MPTAIIEDDDGLRALGRHLRGLDVFWVGLHASFEELERRELQRGDRPVGDAHRDLLTVHSFRSYDLDLDSSDGVGANVTDLVEAWLARPVRPTRRFPPA